MPFSVDGLHDSQYGDEVRVVVKKNGVDTLCDFIYAKARQQLMNRRSMSACTPASSPDTHLEFSINASCEDNGAVLSWQLWMAGRLIDTEKRLLLSVTCGYLYLCFCIANNLLDIFLVFVCQTTFKLFSYLKT